eukprot:TRINITY_DN38240_c0_g1_i1.p1 TRINITY_DN38240_c0_g1~~TRINITY_DN38240_c0_g1_i1.p1  ORF type:complete len:320 (+),score=29.01 TRINITY_DN38240_c0_g1_i1:75-1034(+)
MIATAQHTVLRQFPQATAPSHKGARASNAPRAPQTACKVLPAIAVTAVAARHYSRNRFRGISAVARSARGRRDAGEKKREPLFVSFDDVIPEEPLEDYHAQQLLGVRDQLLLDGMGVIPTDSANAYVASIDSRKGTRRIYEAKGVETAERKPLSLLCADIVMASHYADVGGLPRAWFQALKSSLPGPYTFILRASHDVPRVVLESHGGPRKKSWRRPEVGIRVPACGIVRHLAEELGVPLLASTARGTAMDLWSGQRQILDFVVDLQNPWTATSVQEFSESACTTVIDLTMEEPVLLRHGVGDVSVWEELGMAVEASEG